MLNRHGSRYKQPDEGSKQYDSTIQQTLQEFVMRIVHSDGIAPFMPEDDDFCAVYTVAKEPMLTQLFEYFLPYKYKDMQSQIEAE